MQTQHGICNWKGKCNWRQIPYCNQRQNNQVQSDLSFLRLIAQQITLLHSSYYNVLVTVTYPKSPLFTSTGYHT